MISNCDAGGVLSLLDSKEIKPVSSKGNQFWIFIGRTDAESETPILWPPDAKSRLIRKDADAGIKRRQKEKEMTEYKMVGWHHWFNGHEFEQTLGDGEGQGSLTCCCPWGCKESTWPSDWTATTIFRHNYLSTDRGHTALKTRNYYCICSIN